MENNNLNENNEELLLNNENNEELLLNNENNEVLILNNNGLILNNEPNTALILNNENNEELFGDMIALRIELEDEYYNEINIIKELKIYLLSRRINIRNINQIILDFYNYYNIDIEFSTIEEINIMPINIFDQLSRLTNINTNTINNTNNTTNLVPSLFNIISTMINSTMNENNNELEDVIVTVDDDDLKKLKKTILSTKLESDCSICMDSMDINNEIIELNCSHKYHSECILTYLKKYNHKCPVCRIDAGNLKYNI